MCPVVEICTVAETEMWLNHEWLLAKQQSSIQNKPLFYSKDNVLTFDKSQDKQVEIFKNTIKITLIMQWLSN